MAEPNETFTRFILNASTNGSVVIESALFSCISPRDDHLVIAGVNMVVGLICGGTSCLVIAAVFRFKCQQVPGNYYLMSLAFNGIVQAVLQFFNGVVENESVHYWYHTSQNFCLARIAVSHAGYLNYFFNVSIIAFDRYLYIKHPLKHVRKITRTNVVVSILIVWVVSMAYGMAAFAFQKSRPYNLNCCVMNQAVAQEYSLYVLLTCYCVSLAVNVYAYGSITLLSLRASRAILKQRKSVYALHQPSQQQFVRRNTIIARIIPDVYLGRLSTSPFISSMDDFQQEAIRKIRSFSLFFAIMVTLLCTWGPYFLFRLCIVHSHCDEEYGNPKESEWLLTAVQSNSSLLCIIYAYFNVDLRNAVKVMLLGRLQGGIRKRFVDDEGWESINKKVLRQPKAREEFSALLHEVQRAVEKLEERKKLKQLREQQKVDNDDAQSLDAQQSPVWASQSWSSCSVSMLDPHSPEIPDSRSPETPDFRSPEIPDSHSPGITDSQSLGIPSPRPGRKRVKLNATKSQISLWKNSDVAVEDAELTTNLSKLLKVLWNLPDEERQPSNLPDEGQPSNLPDQGPPRKLKKFGEKKWTAFRWLMKKPKPQPVTVKKVKVNFPLHVVERLKSSSDRGHTANLSSPKTLFIRSSLKAIKKDPGHAKAGPAEKNDDCRHSSAAAESLPSPNTPSVGSSLKATKEDPGQAKARQAEEDDVSLSQRSVGNGKGSDDPSLGLPRDSSDHDLFIVSHTSSHFPGAAGTYVSEPELARKLTEVSLHRGSQERLLTVLFTKPGSVDSETDTKQT